MDKNGKVQVIRLSEDYIKGYEGSRWDNTPSKVVIYDPFIDGDIDALLPEPVAITHTGGGYPPQALTFTFPVEE